MKRQNEEFGCRKCHVRKQFLSATTTEVECLLHERTTASTNQTRKEAVEAAISANAVSAGDAVMQAAGLALPPSPFDWDGFDAFEGLPHEVFHSEYLGMCLLVLSWFAQSLREETLSELNARLPRVLTPARAGNLVTWVLTVGSKGAPRKLKLKGQPLATAVQVICSFCFGVGCTRRAV